jgi:two-component system OmpR family response regulator
MLAAIPQRDEKRTSAEVRIRTLADDLRRLARASEGPGRCTSLVFAASTLESAAERLVADSLLATEGLHAAPPSFDMSPVTVGQLTFDRRTRGVTIAGVRIGLTPTEFRLLSVLVTDPTRVFEKRELYRRVWGGDGAGYRTLDTHMYRLRLRLGGAGWVPSVRGVGYSLLPDAPVLTEAGA